MNGSIARALWRAAVLLVVVLLAATLWAVTQRLNGSGGNDPAGTDPTITDISADIRSTIDAIERFRQATGAYPKSADDLAGRLPAAVIADASGGTLSFDTGGGAVWLYSRRQDGMGYELTRHLGDGRRIAAICDHGAITWHATGADDSAPSMLPPDG